MKILFDANTPAPLAQFFQRHQVVRADELKWEGLGNGTLLEAPEGSGFDLLVTCDQNVPYQQNLAGRKSNHWPTLRQVASRIATVIRTC